MEVIKHMLKKLALPIFCCICLFASFSFPVSLSAEQVTDFPEFVTDDQYEWLYQFLQNYEAYPDLAVFFNPPYQSVYVCQDIDNFNFDSGKFTLHNTQYMNQSSYIGTGSASSTVTNFRTDSRQFLFLKVDGVYYFGPTFIVPYAEGFMVHVSQSISDVEYTYDREYYTDWADVSFYVPSVTYNFSGDLTCTHGSNGVCSIWSSDSGNVAGDLSDPLSIETEAHYILGEDSANNQFTSAIYNYTVETVYEFLFPDYYSGYFVGDFSGYSSDNAIIINDRLYFTDTSKITLKSFEHYSKTSISIPVYSFIIRDYNFQLSKGRPIYDATGNLLLESGNSTSQSSSGSLESVTIQFDSTSSQLESFESQFNGNLSDSLSSIDITSGSLSNVSDFVSTASFVKTQFDTVLNESGYYKTAITFSLIVGLALLLIGRRS